MTTHLPEEQISAWIDRQLDAREAALVETHLSQCVSCRQLQEALLADTRMFRELAVLPPPTYLWTRIEAGLQAPSERKRFTWLQWPAIAWPSRQALLATAGALFMVLGGAFFMVLRQQAALRSEVAAMAQIDQAHAALVSRDTETYNPFSTTSTTSSPDRDSNPFSRHALDSNSNPFASFRETR